LGNGIGIHAFESLSHNSLVAYRRTWLKIIADMAVVLSSGQSWCVDRF
jgi:hypothetical protein